MTGDIRQLTLVKKGHYFLFRYKTGEEACVLQALIEKAQDPASDINWFDAAVLSHQMGHRIAGELQTLLAATLTLPVAANAPARKSS